MLSHDQMAFSVSKLHPDLLLGKDFWTAHPVAPNSEEQIREAEIIAWYSDISQPETVTLRKIFTEHADEWEALQKQRFENSDQAATT